MYTKSIIRSSDTKKKKKNQHFIDFSLTFNTRILWRSDDLVKFRSWNPGTKPLCSFKNAVFSRKIGSTNPVSSPDAGSCYIWQFVVDAYSTQYTSFVYCSRFYYTTIGSFVIFVQTNCYFSTAFYTHILLVLDSTTHAQNHS